MLRQTNELNHRSPGRKSAVAVIGGVALFALLIAGLRGPATLTVAVAADEPKKEAAPKKDSADDPEEAKMARRRPSYDNVKMILLAMHNYHDAYGHFPPAVVLGPDGKTPHSWRVAILPFLDQQKLYDEYKKDEPWDSEANLKVLMKMPEAYKAQRAGGNPKHFASYFVMTGDKAPFSAEAKKAGVNLRDITDGTSHTLAVVETKREIPWTKPEDLVFEAGKPLPKLGGYFDDGFIVAMFDGSGRFVPKDLRGAEHACDHRVWSMSRRAAFKSQTLELLIQHSDGKAVGEF